MVAYVSVTTGCLLILFTLFNGIHCVKQRYQVKMECVPEVSRLWIIPCSKDFTSSGSKSPQTNAWSWEMLP